MTLLLRLRFAASITLTHTVQNGLSRLPHHSLRCLTPFKPFTHLLDMTIDPQKKGEDQSRTVHHLWVALRPYGRFALAEEGGLEHTNLSHDSFW